MHKYAPFLAIFFIAIFVAPSTAHLAEPAEAVGIETLATLESYEAPATEETSLTEAPTILYFFYSQTCPHCRKEQKFLDKIEDKYPDLDIRRYEAAKQENQQLMVDLVTEHGAEQSLGLVPLTFINGSFFAGYSGDDTTGVAIEQAIQKTLGEEVDEIPIVREGGIGVPIVGTVYPEDYSLPALAVTLGFLDGFNVCSLGALMLIIGLSLKLQRRRAIVLFGGLFIATTALVYGGLIVVWYNIFDVFAQYMGLMKVGVSLMALGGGLYFLKEYLRMHKQGAVCELQESPLINKLMARTGNAFEDGGKLMSILGAVFMFAAVVTVVEFPCSAAVPVVFAGILADAGLSTLAYLSHIGLFVLFYMLDELIIFGIAAYKLKMWMTSGTFTKWAVLAEAVILIGIGIWYLGATLGLL